MSFRSNVQRAGATTTRYSGTANVSARNKPLGQASITRAGEVVIKQGSQTTYIPPATFSGGKAAYQSYERIKSAQGQNAASQMAKEVAKGNLQTQGIIKPSISYAGSREASRQYRLDREGGMQTISGSIGVKGNLASGIQTSAKTSLQPTMTPESKITYHTIVPKQPTETMAQRLHKAPPNITDYATAGTSEYDQIAYLGMSAGFTKKYKEAEPELLEMQKPREIQVPRSRWGTSSTKYGEVNEIGQIVKPPAGAVLMETSPVSVAKKYDWKGSEIKEQPVFGKTLYDSNVKEIAPTGIWGVVYKVDKAVEKTDTYVNKQLNKIGLHPEKINLFDEVRSQAKQRETANQWANLGIKTRGSLEEQYKEQTADYLKHMKGAEELEKTRPKGEWANFKWGIKNSLNKDTWGQERASYNMGMIKLQANTEEEGKAWLEGIDYQLSKRTFSTAATIGVMAGVSYGTSFAGAYMSEAALQGSSR